jgi:hypothetical protein
MRESTRVNGEADGCAWGAVLFSDTNLKLKFVTVDLWLQSLPQLSKLIKHTAIVKGIKCIHNFDFTARGCTSIT